MQKARLLILVLSFFIAGCSGKNSSSNNIAIIESQVKKIVDQNLSGYGAGNIDLAHRKLTLDEVASYLELNKQAAKQSLKESNTHGYYSLISGKCPPGMEFTLYHIDIAGNVRPAKNYQANANGLLLTSQDNTWIDIANNYLFFANYLPGEPADFVLRSMDGRYFGWTRILPNPIEARDIYNRQIMAQIISKDKRKFLVQYNGLKPNESYLLISAFGNEKTAHTATTDKKGSGSVIVGSNNPYNTKGKAFLEITGNNEPPLRVSFKRE